MALSTETFLTLKQKLLEACGDYLAFDTTTNITTDNAVVSTELKQYDEASNGFFDQQWLYITEDNNAAVERQTGLPTTTTYATATGTLTVTGATLSAETAAVTCWLTKHKPELYDTALKEAMYLTYPYPLHVPVDDMTLITGNILPDASFESWSSATALNWWTTSTGTLAQTTTDGLYRGQRGTTSCKITAGAANDYIEIDSDTYPRLLDLMNRTVNAYIWAYPETADDCTIEIYTLQADGTADTLTSTTAAPATKWTKLVLENQLLDNKIQYIRIRFKVATNGQYCYFDDAYVGSQQLSEYLLPETLYGGHIQNVYLQQASYSTEPFDDIHPFSMSASGKPIPFSIIQDKTQRFLKLNTYVPSERRIRLIGDTPLEAPSTDASTVTIEKFRVPLLIAQARMVFWERVAVPVGSEESARTEAEYSKAVRDYRKMLYSGMTRPAKYIGE